MRSHIPFLTLLYFLQGLPYGLQSRYLPLYFRSRGMSLKNIGQLKLLLLPWMLKAIWAPFVDRYGTKKQWLAYSMLALFLTCLFGTLISPESISEIIVVLFTFNLLTATQDIVVDSLAIQILKASELAVGNIAQVVGYKLGAVFSGGVITWLSGIWQMEWSSLFICLGVFYITAYLIILKTLPWKQLRSSDSVKTRNDDKVVNSKVSKDQTMNEVEDGGKEDRLWFLVHLKTVITSAETRWTLLYVLLYKLGEQGTLTIIPLFLLDRGVPTSYIGFWTGVIGEAVSIFGSVLGGWLVSAFRFSPYSVISQFTYLRPVLICLQLILTIIWPPDTNYSMVMFGCVVIVMSVLLLGSGVVTTTTFTLMMYCSQMSANEIQASHYTTLATVEVLGKLVFSVLIGQFADIFGYPLTFMLCAILGCVVIPVLYKCPHNLVHMKHNQ